MNTSKQGVVDGFLHGRLRDWLSKLPRDHFAVRRVTCGLLSDVTGALRRVRILKPPESNIDSVEVFTSPSLTLIEAISYCEKNTKGMN